MISESMKILYPRYGRGGRGHILDYSVYTHKSCSKCRQVKDVSEFQKEKRKECGVGWRYRSWCKLCIRPLNTEYARKRRRARGILEKKAAPEPVRKRKRRLISRKSYYKHLNKNLHRVREWRKKNQEKLWLMEKRRRALKRNASGSHTFLEWQSLVREYGHMCPYCQRKEPEIRLTEDHIVPLSKGGTDNIDNIQPLCLSCNCSKGARQELRYETNLFRFSDQTV